MYLLIPGEATMNLAQVTALITHYEAMCAQEGGAILDYPSLKAEVLRKELVSELCLLKELLKTPEAFKAGLQHRLGERAQDQEHCASFEGIPQSPTNQLYWEMAMEAFAPKTLGELLTYLSPNTKRVVVADIDEGAIALRAKDNRELSQQLKVLQDNLPLKLEEKAFKAEDFPQAPSQTGMGELILVEGCLFDVARINRFPLKTSSDLLIALEAQHPKLLVKLLNHNEAMQALKSDVALFRNNAFTPREALLRLCKGLRLGGQRMTGQEFASTSAESALKEFFEYFSALPQALKVEIRALTGENKSMEQVFSDDLDKGHCVETTASDIEAILQANPGNKALNSPPHLSLEARALLIKKYRKERPCAQNFDFTSLEHLPKKHLLGVLETIKTDTAQALVSLLINFPPQFYAALLGGLFKQEGNDIILTHLRNALAENFFNQEQRKALAYALGQHYSLISIHYLWESYDFSDWPFVVDVFFAIPENHRLDVIHRKDEMCFPLLHRVYDNPESLKALLSLVPEKKRLEALKMQGVLGQTVLHRAYDNPELLQALLSLVPKEERMEAVKLQDDIGGTLLLPKPFYNPKSLLAILSLVPENARLEAVKVENNEGTMVLHWVFDNPETLQVLLSLVPEEERLHAVTLKDERGQTPLHRYYHKPETLQALLSLVPEEKRLEAVKAEDNEGSTVLDEAADSPESLKVLLSLVPKKQRLEAVKVEDDEGRTVLYWAARRPESLKAILSLLPEEGRLDLVKAQNKRCRTVLHLAADDPESLKVLLSLVPEKERLEAVKVQNNYGNTVLHCAATNPESLKVLLSLVPQKERLEAVKSQNNQGSTALHEAADNPESLKAILSQVPEKERLDALKVQNNRDTIVLHWAFDNPESLKAILSLVPEKQRLETVKLQDIEGRTVLHWAFDNPESLKAILSLVPEKERLEAVKVQDTEAETVFHRAAKNPESLKALLSLVPEKERLEAMKVQDELGRTVLHRGAAPESLNALLSLVPEKERLEAVRAQDNQGCTVLYWVASKPESLKVILTLYPEKERLQALKVTNKNNGFTVLHRAASNPELLKALLSLYPEEGRLEAVKAQNKKGYTVLQLASKKPGSLVAILSLAPEEERMLILKTEIDSHLVCDELKDTSLELEHSFAPSYIRLHHFLKSQSTGPASSSFFAHPTPNSLINGFKNAQSFAEVKQVVVDFLSDNHHESLPLTQGLWNLLAPNSEKSIDALRAQWGMPLGGVGLAGRGF
jgi:ankyrin repeat protein